MSPPVKGKFRSILFEDAEEWKAYYAKPFNARRAIMLHVVNLGWELPDCRLHFTNELVKGSRLWRYGEDGRALSPTETDKRITEDFEACQQKADESPAYLDANEARLKIGEVADAVNSRAWGGPTGKVDQAVMRGLIKKADAIGSDLVHMSAREASLLAGTTVKTASRALNRLVRRGWTAKHIGSTRGHAAGWKLLGVPLLPHITYPHRVMCGTSGTHVAMLPMQPGDEGHETWVRLGKYARAVYYALSMEPKSIRAIATGATVGVATVHRNLAKMKAYGLCVQTDDGWITGPRTPDDVSDDMGWVGDNSKVLSRTLDIEADRQLFKDPVRVRVQPEIPVMPVTGKALWDKLINQK